MNPFNELTEDNHAQIRKYLRFFRQKKEACVRSLKREFLDTKEEKLNDAVISRDEAVEMIDFLESSITVQVEADISSIVNMGALALDQLLQSAQDKGVELILETAKVENARLLEEVEKMSLDAIPKHQRRGVGELTSIKDEAKALREATGRLEVENKQLVDRYGHVQAEASVLARERNMIQAEVSTLKHRLEEAESRAGKAETKQSSDVRDQLERLERALENALEESTRRVSETAQFKQMKTMMQTQSKKIVELRKRLNKYEPDDSKGDDDDF